MAEREGEGEESDGIRSCDLEEEEEGDGSCDLEGGRGVAGAQGRFFRVGGAPEGVGVAEGGTMDDKEGAAEGVGGAVHEEGGGVLEGVGVAREVGGVLCNEVERERTGDQVTVYISCDHTNPVSHGETTGAPTGASRPLKFTHRASSMKSCPLPPEKDICLLVNLHSADTPAF